MPDIDIKKHELRGALVGGSIAAIALFATVIGVGRIGNFEALRLIEAILPTARFLGSTAIGAAVTVLALLLTVLGLSFSADFDFNERFYRRVRYIATMSVVAIGLGVAVLLAVTLPIEQVDEVQVPYAFLYYSMAVGLATLGGMLVAIGLMIGATIRGIIAIGHPEASSDLIAGSEQSDD